MLGCETNPPTQPVFLKDGEVQIEMSVNENDKINSERTEFRIRWI